MENEKTKILSFLKNEKLRSKYDLTEGSVVDAVLTMFIGWVITGFSCTVTLLLFGFIVESIK